jgi:hypothetical protein
MSKPFTIYVMQSAHTDIGYTHPQNQIRLMYLEHYDHLLELCNKTQSEPENQRFKWTCETFWQVRHYLEHRPEKLEEFLACVRRGQIEVTANYLHFSDAMDADSIARSLDFAAQFRAQNKIPISTAIHADINGWAWSLADSLSERQVKHFLSMVHLDSGTDPLGARGTVHYPWLDGGMAKLFNLEKVPVRIPKAFWWEGPAGGKVLTWLGEHYMIGNMLGISSPAMFGGDKTRYFLETDRLTGQDLLKIAREKVPLYVDRMKRDGYGLDALLVSTGGFYVDNAPPNDRWLEVIKNWNGFANIELRTCTSADWFTYLEGLGTDSLPTYKVAWPDHWAHGLGSETARMAQARRTQRRRADAVALAQQSGSAAAKQHLEAGLEQERLSLEHTFNAWSTAHRPASPLNEFQQSVKAVTFHQAEMELDESIGLSLRAVYPAAAVTELYARASTDSVQTLHFNAGDQKLEPSADTLVSKTGQVFAIQQEHANLLNFVAVVQGKNQEVTALTPVRNPNIDVAAAATIGALGAPLVLPNDDDDASSAELASQLTLESKGWSLTLDPKSGGVSSLFDRLQQREWAGTHEYKFGQVVHESVTHPLGRTAVHNMARFVQLGVASQFSIDRLGDTPAVTHSTLQFEREVRRIRGAVYDALEITGHSPVIGSVLVSWRVYHNTPLVELVLDWNKLYNELPESAYVAFPFLQGKTLEFETAGGFFTPGSHQTGGQLPGTSSRYYTIQRTAQITHQDGAKLLWSPVDAPLVMTQKIAFNDWETEPYQWNGFLASMPVNHYWHTNFALSQRGHIRLRYRFFAPTNDLESSIRQTLPLEALGWR